MKCPTCGETIRNGRCPFCGYRPTTEDMAAEARWAEEKRHLSGGAAGPDWKAERPGIMDIASRVKAGAAARTPRARPKAQAEGAQGRKPPREPARQAVTKEPRPERQKPRRKAREKHKVKGVSMGLVLKLVVALWFLAVFASFCSVLAGEYGIDIPGMLGDLLRWIGHKLSGEPEYIVPQGNYILYG